MDWTPARRKSFIVSVLRAGTRRWPPKYETLNEAKTEKKINVQTGRVAQHYRCANCQEDFPAKAVNVDHITPVVGVQGFTTWDEFIEGLFCGKENLQVLCTSCHNEKSASEKITRKKDNSENQSKKRISNF